MPPVAEPNIPPTSTIELAIDAAREYPRTPLPVAVPQAAPGADTVRYALGKFISQAGLPASFVDHASLRKSSYRYFLDIP